MLTLDKIYHAAYVLKKIARKTDMIAAPLLNTESNIFLKTENLQAVLRCVVLIIKLAS